MRPVVARSPELVREPRRTLPDSLRPLIQVGTASALSCWKVACAQALGCSAFTLQTTS